MISRRDFLRGVILTSLALFLCPTKKQAKDEVLPTTNIFGYWNGSPIYRSDPTNPSLNVLTIEHIERMKEVLKNNRVASPYYYFLPNGEIIQA